MAKPIEGIPPFRGSAAKWLDRYLSKAHLDPAKQERIERADREIAQKVKPLNGVEPEQQELAR